MSSGARNPRHKYFRKTKAQLIEELEKLERQVADGERAGKSSALKPAMPESEERFRFAFENAPVGMALISPEGRRFKVNKALADFLGYTVEELADTDMKSTAADFDDLDESMRLRQQILDGEITTYRNERRYRHKKGHVVWGEVSGSLFRNEDGEPEHFIAHTIDITERKRAEETQREIESRFQAIVNSSPAGISLKDLDGRYLLVNETFETWMATDTSNIVGHTVDDFLSPEQAAQVKAEDSRLLETGERTIEEASISFPDGVNRTVWVHRCPIHGDDGEIIAIAAILTDITGRVEAEEAKHRLVAAIEGLSENFALYGPDEKLVICNENYRRNNDPIPEATNPGILYEDHVRAVAENGLAPESLGREEEWVQQRLDSFRNPGKPYEVARQDGRWFLVHEQRMPDGSTATISTDITERKRTEEALRKSEERLRGAIGSLHEGFALYDTDDRLIAFNDKYRHLWPQAPEIKERGGTFEDMIRSNVAKGKILEAQGREEAFIQERLEQHRKLEGPIIRQFNDGSWYRIEEVRTPEGGTAVSFIDITELQQAKEARERLTKAVENLPVGIALFDSDDRLVFCNNRYTELQEILADILKPGVTFEKLLRTIMDRQPVKDARGREEEYIQERIKHHRNPTGPMILNRGGEWLMVEDLRLPDGSIFTIFSNVTEQKQAEEDRRLALMEAERANQAKSEFLATMSHELRTPLNAILGFADILSHQYFGPIGDKNREYAGDIKASGEHLLELVNDLLDLSTIEAGKQSLVKENLSTAEIVTECERIVEDKARSHGIDLVTKVPKDLPPLYADRRASKQILLNLLSNAVKFTPPGGRITVSAKASKRNMTLKIADTGKGIAAENLPKPIDPFTRADSDPYLAERGWGLGLTITKSLIDLHDGTLDIKSTVGKGTTVTVTFPNGAP